MKIKELSKFKFKNSIPVLDNLKFENGKVTFGSLDSKITMETDVVGNGLVNFDEVKKILAKYPDAQCILNGKFEITKGNKKFTIQAESIEDYPTDVLPGEYIMDLTIDKEFNSLKDYLGKDDWRPSLTGVLVEKEYMVATNTHILKKIKVDGCNDPIILPPDIFKCELGTYKVFKHKDGVTLIGDITYQFMLIDERYPDWKSVWPTENPIQFVIDKKLFIEAVNDTLMVANYVTKQCTLDIKALTISGEDIDLGTSYVGKLPGAKTIGEINIAFNGEFMLKVLKGCSLDTVTLAMSIPNRAIVVNDHSIIMPAMTS